jgi:hypothetical protein
MFSNRLLLTCYPRHIEYTHRSLETEPSELVELIFTRKAMKNAKQKGTQAQ